MTCVPRPSEFTGCPRREHGRVTAPRPGWLRRVYDAVFDSRQKQAERVVAAYLEHTGGRFTDDIERRLTERLITGEWRR